MFVSDHELFVVIAGRYPMSFMANRFSIYDVTCMSDDDYLLSFLESPDIFSSHISIVLPNIYVSIEIRTIVQEPINDENDF